MKYLAAIEQITDLYLLDLPPERAAAILNGLEQPDGYAFKKSSHKSFKNQFGREPIALAHAHGRQTSSVNIPTIMMVWYFLSNQ